MLDMSCFPFCRAWHRFLDFLQLKEFVYPPISCDLRFTTCGAGMRAFYGGKTVRKCGSITRETNTFAL
jgi:hypothetical protein